MPAMGFEGAEKKFEIVSKGSCLRQRTRGFWEKAVALANAKILSQISNEACTAYLLSESSLFVWDDRVTMITCGRTSLVRAAAFLIDEFGAGQIDLLTFQRKNEFFPHMQETDFFRDAEILGQKCKGKAFRFGLPDEHHLFLFHGDSVYRPIGADCTLEILMYNLRAKNLSRPDLTGLERILPGFQIDEHEFKPCGYSLNAIRGNEYYTIHITPEADGSYVSFETNVGLGERIPLVLKNVVELFQPRSFDVVYFHPEEALKAFAIAPFQQRHYVRQSLSCGLEVGFSTYYLNTKEPLIAVPVEVAP